MISSVFFRRMTFTGKTWIVAKKRIYEFYECSLKK